MKRFLSPILMVVTAAMFITLVSFGWSHGTGKQTLFVTTGTIAMWNETRIDLQNQNSIQHFALAQSMQVIGPVQPGKNVNLVYRHSATADVAVLLQMRPEMMVAAAASTVSKDSGPLQVPDKIARSIWKIVGRLKVAPGDSEPQAPHNTHTREPVLDGSVLGIKWESPFNAALVVSVSAQPSPEVLLVDFFTVFDEEINHDAPVTVSYKSVDGRKVATRVRTHRQTAAPVFMTPNVPNSPTGPEPESGGVASIDQPSSSSPVSQGSTSQGAISSSQGGEMKSGEMKSDKDMKSSKGEKP